MTFWLAQWILKKQDERFLQALIETKAQVDETSDAQVRRVLLGMRAKRAFAPYVAAIKRFGYIFKLAKEIINGRYRKSGSTVHGSTNATSGGSPGATGQPVAQFSGYGGGFSAPVAATGPSPGGVAGLPQPGMASSSTFEDAGIKAGEVTAYRCWRMRGDGLLTSCFMSDVVWVPGLTMEGKPEEAGEGVHAFKSRIWALKYGVGYSGESGVVTGTVELWGEVYEHERGYRASYAVIKSIDDSGDYDAKSLRKLYGLNKRRKKPLTRPEA